MTGQAAVGEVGLGGELRSVPGIERRVREAYHLGFASMLLPAGNAAELEVAAPETEGLTPVDTLTEAMALLNCPADTLD